jgi:eukaryotic-like serine/threonine-protein kinase
VVSWVVPGYAEERELGAGASGRVVAAVHVASGTQVAIKYLSPRLLIAPGFVEAFRSEAALLQTVNVPQVVRLFGYVEASGLGAAIIMELVDGVSLHDMITRQGPAGPESALLVLKGSLLGLAAAHALGIVHRDYKPENVLVDGHGTSKLTDFGAAARAGQAASGGTPLYMAPEQWGGAPASPAADIYAATAVFFECLTGKAPFSGTLARLAAQHEQAAVPVDLIEEPLRPLVARGMAKDPAARPASAAGFVAELEAAATMACGAGWESAGRAQLAARAAGLLALASACAGGATAATSGASTAVTWLSTVKAAIAAHAFLYTGIAAVIVGIAGGALAGITRAPGHLASRTVAASGTATSGTAASSATPPPSPPATATPSLAAGTTPAPGPALDLTKVDWRRLAIPGSWFLGPASVQLQPDPGFPSQGIAQDIPTRISAVTPNQQVEVRTGQVNPQGPVYGQMGGVQVAAVPVQVAEEPAGTADAVRCTAYLVYKAGTARPLFIGVAYLEDGWPAEWLPNHLNAGNADLLVSASFSNGDLVVQEDFYGPNDPTARPTGRGQTIWSLSGSTLHYQTLITQQPA